MPDAPLKVHTDQIPITGLTHNNQWNTVDLSSYLTHDDPKIVLICVYKDQAVSGNAGVRPVAAGQPGGSGFANIVAFTAQKANDFNIIAVPLNSSNQIQYRLTNSACKIALMAEMGGDTVKTFSDYDYHVSGRTNNDWGEEDITALVGSDSENVEGVVCVMSNINQGRAMIRAAGSSDTLIVPQATSQVSFITAKVNDEDVFERWVSATEKGEATGSIFMAGYWTRDEQAGVRLVATQDRDPAFSGTFYNALTDVEVSVRAEREVAALVNMRLDGNVVEGGQPLGYVRSKGSTNILGVWNSATTNVFPVALNADELAEYYQQTSLSTFSIRIEAVQYVPLADFSGDILYIGLAGLFALTASIAGHRCLTSSFTGDFSRVAGILATRELIASMAGSFSDKTARAALFSLISDLSAVCDPGSGIAGIFDVDKSLSGARILTVTQAGVFSLVSTMTGNNA